MESLARWIVVALIAGFGFACAVPVRQPLTVARSFADVDLPSRRVERWEAQEAKKIFFRTVTPQVAACVHSFTGVDEPHPRGVVVAYRSNDRSGVISSRKVQTALLSEARECVERVTSRAIGSGPHLALVGRRQARFRHAVARPLTQSGSLNGAYAAMLVRRLEQEARRCLDEAFPDPTVSALARIVVSFRERGVIELHGVDVRAHRVSHAETLDESADASVSFDEVSLRACVDAVAAEQPSPRYTHDGRWNSGASFLVRRPASADTAGD